MHNLSGAYGAFTAAMVLRYASTRTVCQLTPEAHGSYEGGCTIPPRPGYLLDRPIVQSDFVSMYPSIACVINAGKDTFVSKGGHWHLGEFGGFSTLRRGFLADVLRNLLDERLRIVDDPAMKGRAVFLTNDTSSTQYMCPPLAFACLPDGQGSWFHLPTEPTSLTCLGLFYEAMRIVVRHGRYSGDSEVLEAISAYPAHRLRVAPPPVLKKDGKAPVPAWQEVMNELAESAERPKLVTTTTFHCQACRTIFNLEIGACGHLACKTCSVKWKTCPTCKVEWHGLDFHGTPQVNYHPRAFPFEEWYEYLPVTKWRVYRGPDELIYDSSAAHIIALAQGKVCK